LLRRIYWRKSHASPRKPRARGFCNYHDRQSALLRQQQAGLLSFSLEELVMNKFISAAGLALFSVLAWADETAAVVPSPEEVSPTAMIVVVLLIVAMVGGFIAFTMLKDRKRKDK
jgi:hypothetical protein